MDTKYVIINAANLDDVDFDDVNNEVRSSPQSLRFSRDGSKFLFEYTGDQPSWIYSKITQDFIGLPEYNTAEILVIISGSDWS